MERDLIVQQIDGLREVVHAARDAGNKHFTVLSIILGGVGLVLTVFGATVTVWSWGAYEKAKDLEKGLALVEQRLAFIEVQINDVRVALQLAPSLSTEIEQEKLERQQALQELREIIDALGDDVKAYPQQ